MSLSNLLYSYECTILYDQSGTYQTLGECVSIGSQAYCMANDECNKIDGTKCYGGGIYANEQACISNVVPQYYVPEYDETGYVCTRTNSPGYTLDACNAVGLEAYCYDPSANVCTPITSFGTGTECPKNNKIYHNEQLCNEQIKYNLIAGLSSYACLPDSKAVMSFEQCVANGTVATGKIPGTLNNAFCSVGFDLGGCALELFDACDSHSERYANSDTCVADVCTETGEACASGDDMFVCVPSPSSCYVCDNNIV